ncbi:subunit of N oligosaccharyltransferase complex [Scheffersomyces xylosifermentans]|uniref:subunit of N oligosaccharyltransferase complex n=1 Tax=Scheffersomyces xylosifermentans TaxID=1304137 RepID=UPI00315D7C28
MIVASALFYVIFFLISAVASSSIRALRLTEESFLHQEHVISITNSDLSLVSGPRDYYVLTVLTSTDPKHNCKVCTELESVVARVSNSWFSDYAGSNLLFILSIDIVDRTNIKLFDRVQVDSVPHVWLFPPNMNKVDLEDPEAEKKDLSIFEDLHYEYKTPQAPFDDQALELARFLSDNIQKPITLRQKDPMATFIKTFSLTLAIIILIKKKGPAFITGTPKKQIIMLLAVAFILCCVCGYQFCNMRGVPFVARNEKGLIYISGGAHYQFGVEILLVAANYSALAAALILLLWLGSYKVGRKTLITEESTKFVLIIVMNFVLYLLYSTLTSIFLRKEPNYPYPFTKLF